MPNLGDSAKEGQTEGVEHSAHFCDSREQWLRLLLSLMPQFHADQGLGVQLGGGTFGVGHELNELAR